MQVEDPDHALVRDCQDPGADAFEEAFTQLYDKYKDRVYNLAWRVTGNSAEAMDICQETFVLLLRKITGFKFESKFSSWLYRIVVNTSIDSRRRLTSRGKREQDIQANPQTGGHVEFEDERQVLPEKVAITHESGEIIQQEIQKLSPKLRLITILRYMEGNSYDDLAEILEISLGTVKSRLARAHLALSQRLGSVLDQGEDEKTREVDKRGEP